MKDKGWPGTSVGHKVRDYLKKDKVLNRAKSQGLGGGEQHAPPAFRCSTGNR